MNFQSEQGLLLANTLNTKMQKNIITEQNQAYGELKHFPREEKKKRVYT